MPTVGFRLEAIVSPAQVYVPSRQFACEKVSAERAFPGCDDSAVSGGSSETVSGRRGEIRKTVAAVVIY